MGCGGSKATANPQPEVGRRRLSISHGEGSDAVSSAEVVEENRGLIQVLSQQNVLDMLASDVNGRKFSIGSAQDAGTQSFQNKQQTQQGDKIEDSSMGYTCRKGLKPESPNQDAWTVLKVAGDYTIYGVFDGHGQKGHDISNFVKETLPKLILKDRRFKPGGEDHGVVLKDAFKKIQSLISTCDQMKQLDAKLSGTTCTIGIHDYHTNKLTIAHVADSTGVLGTRRGDEVTGEPITRDHKPDLKDERARIEKAGGRVVFDGYTNHRVYAKNGRYPGLNMSRCLGDLLGHQDCGVTCEPEISVYEIKPENNVLLFCSDGVWEFITPAEAVKLVSEYEPVRAMQAADKLAKEAWDRWIEEEGGSVVDDITVVLVFLQHRPTD